MSFDALLADLDALQKAAPPAKPKNHAEPDADNAGGPLDNDHDDALIQQAASGDADDDGTPDGEDLPEPDEDVKAKGKRAGKDDEDEDEDDDEDDDEDEYLGKAFTMTGPDGETIRAYDGAALLKGFHQRLSALESAVLKTLQAQTALIKSLRAEVTTLQEQGRGRKTVLNIHEKPVGHFASSPPTPKALLAKALSAQKTGQLTGQDVARIETYLGRGLELPPDLAALLN